MKKPSPADIATAALREELAKFNTYAEKKLQVSGHESLEELLGLWRANHPVPRTAAKAATNKSAAAKPATPNKPGVPYL